MDASGQDMTWVPRKGRSEEEYRTEKKLNFLFEFETANQPGFEPASLGPKVLLAIYQ